MSIYQWFKGNTSWSGSTEDQNVATVSNVTNGSSKVGLDASVIDSLERIHVRTHQGRAYTYSSVISIAGNSAYNILFDLTTVGSVAHIGFHLNSSGDSKMEFFEGCTVSSNGTSIVATNNNRNSSNVDVHKLYHTPTITNDGSTLSAAFVSGGAGPQASGGQSAGLHRGGAEWLLNTSKKYLFRVTNLTAQTITCDPSFTYYLNT